MSPRILFVLKHREGYWGTYCLSSGLLNSVTFIVDMLNDLGIEAKLVQVPDNNHIDREITLYRPTICIVEAFWVVPSKFDILKRLHPHVHFAVRNHSEIPFLSNEGIAMDWIKGYLNRGIEVMSNSPRAVVDIQTIANLYGKFHDLISYAPNYYPIVHPPRMLNAKHRRADNTIRVGCFGSIRPLKNQLAQAVAAIRFAEFLGKRLEFHINGGRIEGYGETILRNLRSMFDGAMQASLVEHPWAPHMEFLKVLSEMDYLMQVSFSETFNIVSADAVRCMVPVVASEEVQWLGRYAWADPNDTTSMVTNLIDADRQIRHHPTNNRLIWQWRDLSNYSERTKRIWWDRFGLGKPFAWAN